MKVIDLKLSSSEPAPKNWESLPYVKKMMPKILCGELSLQRYLNTPVCQWHIRQNVYWEPTGPMMFVKK